VEPKPLSPTRHDAGPELATSARRDQDGGRQDDDLGLRNPVRAPSCARPPERHSRRSQSR
jgi:hypothetical protein